MFIVFYPKMPSILIVEKLGSIKTLSIKTYSESELYKKAGLKSPDGFKCQTTWQLEIDNSKYYISLYAKTTGRANQENKYEFPPPVDKALYFGNCILVNTVNGMPTDFSVKEWEEIYEALYGGFEDLGDEDSDDDEDEDDELNEPGAKLSKAGYLKDGFIVDEDEIDDDEMDEDEIDEDEEDDDEDEEAPKIKSKASKLKKKPVKKASKKEFEIPIVEQEELYLDCSSELSEEEYV